MSHSRAELYEQAAVFRAGHAWWATNPEQRWSVVMGMVYGDVSGDESDILTAGCYLGHEPQWLAAIAEWSKALDEAGVNEFHATDFYSAQRAFDDDRWRKRLADGRLIPGGPLHEQFAARFCAVASDARLIGFAFALEGKSFREILAPELQRTGRRYHGADPRTWTIMSSLSGVNDFLASTKYRDKGRIQVVFEHEKGAGKFSDYFGESRERDERWTYWFQSFTTAPKSFLPLQMADLLAHEAWRRVHHLLEQKPRPVRKSFERMLVGDNISVRWHGREKAEENAQQVRDLLTRYPDGLSPPDDVRDP